MLIQRLKTFWTGALQNEGTRWAHFAKGGLRKQSACEGILIMSNGMFPKCFHFKLCGHCLHTCQEIRVKNWVDCDKTLAFTSVIIQFWSVRLVQRRSFTFSVRSKPHHHHHHPENHKWVSVINAWADGSVSPSFIGTGGKLCSQCSLIQN